MQVLDAEHAEDVVDDRGRELDVRVAVDQALRLEAREGELVDVAPRAARRTAGPSTPQIAKQFISERKAAPSLCMSMKISPSVPSSYSPVRRKTLWPPTRASCVKPRRFLGRRWRTVGGGRGAFVDVTAAGCDGAVWQQRPRRLRLGGGRLRSSAFVLFLVFVAAVESGWLRLAAVAVERDGLEAELPALDVDVLRSPRPWPRSAG